ncbi:amidase [Oculatella sp. LEGE 06141]|uniref:amidase n=1 Tax=Oculatella sp. LEGE 06141 TaxID=1828648 RepID=UPI00187F9E35|nr:amidase [Oculatella sp. LEGE 06141]MBE9181558.1 amidase [Oculatella sp. LEGE 06141]
MNPVDLAFASALDQAQLIRDGEVSPVELTELYLERIQRLNPTLGSYFTVAVESALADAKVKTEAIAHCRDRATLPPFWGVPISIKDLNAVAGLPCTYGSQVLKGNMVDYDDAVVARIKQAGFIILGKTATPEVGSMPFTEPDGFPPARNPWNVDYTPGGSSGGAAAAVAAGLCSVAQGSDGGGSVRGPASCCGLVGIKPSRGRISSAPVGERLSGMATNGPLARTVADAAALLDVMSGYVTGDPYWLPAPNPCFLDVARRGSQRGADRPLRVAVAMTLPSVAETIDPVCEKAVLDTVQRLQDFGHHVEPACPSVAGLADPFTVVFRGGIAAAGIPAEAMNAVNRWFMSFADSNGDFLRALAEVQIMARRITAFFDTYDLLLTPTYMSPPIRVGEWANLDPATVVQNVVQWIAPCPPFNASGQPAIAIPAGFSPAGLPIGVQIVGRPAAESTLIAIAAQLEAANPWSHLRPAIAVA